MSYLQRIANRISAANQTSAKTITPTVLSASPLAQYDQRSEVLDFAGLETTFPGEPSFANQVSEEHQPVASKVKGNGVNVGRSAIQRESISQAPSAMPSSPVPPPSPPFQPVSQIDSTFMPPDAHVENQDLDRFDLRPSPPIADFIPEVSVDSPAGNHLDEVKPPASGLDNFSPEDFIPASDKQLESENQDLVPEPSEDVTETHPVIDETVEIRTSDDGLDIAMDISPISPTDAEDWQTDVEMDGIPEMTIESSSDDLSFQEPLEAESPQEPHTDQPTRLVIEQLQVDIIQTPQNKAEKSSKLPEILTAESVSVIGSLKADNISRRIRKLRYW